jgi:Holliday junction resolvase
MAVDSKAKGSRAELDAAKFLKTHTGLDFKRVPMSGGLHESHQLKGDLYLVNEKNIYCIEIKHYKECHLTSNILTDKKPQIQEWIEQTLREAEQISRKPLLIFKHDRSKWFVCFFEEPTCLDYRYMVVVLEDISFYLAKLEDWLKHEKPQFK